LHNTMKTIYSRIHRSIQLILERANSLRFTRNGHFMKITTFVGFCVALGASFISAHASDTPAQAAARAALEQKLSELTHPQIEPSPPKNIPSGAAIVQVVQSGQSATNVTDTVPAKAVTPQTAPAATTPVAVPVAATPTVEAPAPTAPAAPVQVPMESFARLPAIRQVTLSPDGKFIAYSMFDDLQSAFAFKEIDTGKTKGVQGTDNFVAVYPRWISNDRVVYGYMAGMNRDGSKYAGLLGRARELDKRDQNRLSTGGILFREFKGESEGHILLNEFDQLPHAYSYGFNYIYNPNVINMDTRTGNYVQIVQNPGKVIGWGTDKDGVVRVGAEYDKGYSAVIYREGENAPWHRLAGLEHIKRTVGLEGISADGATLYVTKPTPTGMWGVYEYDLKNQKLGEMMVGHANFDILRNGISADGHSIERMVFAPRTHELLGIQYVTDVPKVVWFDPTLASIQGALDQGLPHKVNSIVEMSDDMKRFVIFSWSARDPGSYYIFDLEKKQLKQLFATSPWIKPEQMAEVYPISYKSRDGLVIHGYLTVPAGKQPKNLPMVVFPHGGPDRQLAGAIANQ